MNGARWVQESVLETNADADLRVYAIWFSMYPTDLRDAWPADVLTDPRVEHYWDEGKAIGAWYAPRVRDMEAARAPDSKGHEAPVLWDAYLVYGPDARWDQAPTGLRRWGRTILRTRDALRDAVESLVRPAVTE